MWAAVFTEIGRPNNDNVSFLSNTSETPAGKYSINVTQAATQGSLVGANNSISSLIVNSGINDTFTIKVDGTVSSNITLTAGTYANEDELATEIQAQINGNDLLRNQSAKVSVTFDSANNKFLIDSQSYGDSSTVEITQSTGAGLGLSVAAGTAGTNVAGTINGVGATGDGQFLTATNGLKLLIEGNVTGDLGAVNFSRGLMESLDTVLGGLLDSTGSLKSKTEGLQKSLDSISDERLTLADRMEKLEARLLSKFNAMDGILGQIQNTGAFLTQQLASLPFNNLRNNG